MQYLLFRSLQLAGIVKCYSSVVRLIAGCRPTVCHNTTIITVSDQSALGFGLLSIVHSHLSISFGASPLIRRSSVTYCAISFQVLCQLLIKSYNFVRYYHVKRSTVYCINFHELVRIIPRVPVRFSPIVDSLCRSLSADSVAIVYRKGLTEEFIGKIKVTIHA